MRLPTGLRAWKMAPWIRLLSGLTLEPSTVARGADSWIASLRACHVSHIASPARAADIPTNAPSGPSSSASSTSLDPPWSRSKTSLSLFGTSDQSEIDYRHWVTESRDRSLSLRDRLEHRIDASEFSSWPTATGQDCTSRGWHNSRGTILLSLSGAARNWPTPATADSERQSDTYYRGNPTLPGETRNWPTPSTMDGEGTLADNLRTRANYDTNHEINLGQKATLWPTPIDQSRRGTTTRYTRGDIKAGRCLNTEALQWPTLTAHDGHRPGFEDLSSTQGTNLRREAALVAAKGATSRGKRQVGLENQATLWATPTAGDGDQHKFHKADNPTLSYQASRQVLQDLPNGNQFSTSTAASYLLSRPKKRLNPRFDEWMMGWPRNWSLPCATESTGLGSAAMESYLSRQRSLLSRLLGK